MDYTLISPSGEAYVGSGATLRLAITDALGKMAAVELTGLAHGKTWSLAYFRQAASVRKAAIFAAASNYDPVELAEMIAEARDFRISGVTTAARYPLAQALATARGVTVVSVLTGWGNALQAAYTSLAALIRQQEQAETAITGAASLAALRDVMAEILEAIG